LSLIGYLTYFTLFRSADVAAHPSNRRLWVQEENTLRGSIYDASGVVLAKTVTNEKNEQVRTYPYGSLYAHVIGYNSAIYGKSQLESAFNDLLLGKNAFSTIINMGGLSEVGFDLTLTIDHDVQQAAANRLGKRNGAAVAINPRTGEILAMVSSPSFDPNDSALIQNWAKINDDENAPFLARATSGLYPPGSTFKIVTSSAILSEKLDNMTFNDTGSTTIDGKVFKNYKNKSMGKLDLARAFSLSSNVAFCEWGAALGGAKLYEKAAAFGFEKAVSLDIPAAKSRFPQKDMSATDSAAAAIGQWDILATPLQMAKVAGVIANDGVDMPNNLVKKATNSMGLIMYEAKKSAGTRVIPTEDAAKIKDMMVQTVKSGTATSVSISGVTVAGKTGTAENEKQGKEHAWFVGFAPAVNPQIAVAVIVEYSGGTGSELAIPIAREMIMKALN
jgi:peptidoglycan glycosyltransferase